MKTQTFLSISLAFALNSLVLLGFIEESNPNKDMNVNAIFYQEDSKPEMEDTLELEDWMVDDSCWKIDTEKNELRVKEENTEERLVVESWMTDDNLWRL